LFQQDLLETIPWTDEEPTRHPRHHSGNLAGHLSYGVQIRNVQCPGPNCSKRADLCPSAKEWRDDRGLS
jgi:hypothetical protein